MASRVCISNDRDLAELEEGDFIEYERGLFSHWAVYVGNKKVVHLTGVDGVPNQAGNSFSISGVEFDKACVKLDDFWDVAAESKAFKNNTNDANMACMSKMEIVQKAIDSIGNVSYNMFTKNCEHFAKFCRYGEERSDQVRDFILAGAVGLALGLGWIFMSRRDKK